VGLNVTSEDYLKLRKRTDRMGRFSLVLALVWTVNTIVTLQQSLWGLTYIGLVIMFLWLFVSQVGNFRYWWRAFKPIHVSLLPASIEEWYGNGYKRDEEINEWAKKRFGYDVYCHDLGVYSFRKKKHAMAFKLKWAGK